MMNNNTIAIRIMSLVAEMNKCDHIDVKVFAGSKAKRNQLVELINLNKQMTVLDEDSMIARNEFNYVIEQLSNDIKRKLNRTSNNTYTSADDNYKAAMFIYKGVLDNTDLDLTK